MTQDEAEAILKQRTAKEQIPMAKYESLAQKVCSVSLSLRGTKASHFNSVPRPQPCKRRIPLEHAMPGLFHYRNVSYVSSL